jgi:hypothetical protein
MKACEVCGATLVGRRPSAKVCSDACRQRKRRGAAPLSANPAVDPQPMGPIETKVRSDVEALTTAHPMGEALAEMSFTLARAIDQGDGLTSAAVNRELRANLIELARLGVENDSDLDGALSTPTDGITPSEGPDDE